MSAPRRRWLPLAVLGLGVAVAAFFMLTYNPAPVIPGDRDHVSARLPTDCLRCHGPGGSSPRPEDHPISEACLSCHRWEP
jgi:hypothetical protein